jgi:two-component system LytT family sensor kinase
MQKKHLKIAKYAALCHCILYLVIFFTNNWHHLYISSYVFESNGYFPVIISTKELFYGMVVISGTLLSLLSMMFYIRGYIRAFGPHKYGYITMMCASLFPWFTVYFTATDINYLGIDYFPVISIISGILYLLGIFKFRVFNTIPIAKEMVFRQSKEGIALIDLTDRIIDVNDAFLNIYPENKDPSHRLAFNSFIKEHREFKDITDENNKFQYKIIHNGKEQYYLAEINKILSEDNLHIGKIFTISNVTLFVENEKKLQDIASQAISEADRNEIFFLQAQIKPHFLNNTLSVIASMISRDPVEARKLIANLGEYLADCYYFDSMSEMVQLEKELETVSTYVAIEKARFGERLNFSIICENIPEIDVPRLILQPLIENAIRHGILQKADGGNVWLKITYEVSKIYFEVKDDGVGITEERVKALIGGEDPKQGIGILNIHKRLLKYYGEGLKITSIVGQGTSITFSIASEVRSDFKIGG